MGDGKGGRFTWLLAGLAVLLFVTIGASSNTGNPTTPAAPVIPSQSSVPTPSPSPSYYAPSPVSSTPIRQPTWETLATYSASLQKSYFSYRNFTLDSTNEVHARVTVTTGKLNVYLARAEDYYDVNSASDGRVHYYSDTLRKDATLADIYAVLPRGTYTILLDNTGTVPGSSPSTADAAYSVTVESEASSATLSTYVQAAPPPAPKVSSTFTVNYATPAREIFTSISHLPSTLTATVVDSTFSKFSTLALSNQGDAPAVGTLAVTFDGYASTYSQSITIDSYRTQSIVVNPVWNARVTGIQTSTPISIGITITDATSGRTIYSDTQTYKLLPPTYFAWGLNGDNMRDFAPVYSTPGASFIPAILRTAASNTPFKQIVGYQEIAGYTHEQIVEDQMQGIWQALQARGFTYVNAPEAYTTTSSQNIKSPSATFSDRSGNCIESAVLFASIFEKVGFRTYIIVNNTHAWVEVAQWDSGTDLHTIIPLETTMLPSSTFNQALNRGIDEWNANKGNAAFSEISIPEQRANGVQPSPLL